MTLRLLEQFDRKSVWTIRILGTLEIYPTAFYLISLLRIIPSFYSAILDDIVWSNFFIKNLT